ncbi:MAG: hypothetical protein KBD76_01305 [Bacteriovorax sp.]|nr:hypothetical protein [Bacteriovorax sp.]
MKFIKQLRLVTSFLSILSLFIMGVSQTTAVVAQELSETNPITELANVTDFLTSQKLNSPQERAKLKEYELLMSALEERRLKDIPQELIDPEHLVGQTVRIISTNQTYSLDTYVKNIPAEAVDDIIIRSTQDGKLAFVGLRNGEEVIEHLISGLNIVSTVKDEEFTVIMDKSGKIFALDTGHLLTEMFKGIVPVYKIYDVNSNTLVRFNTGKEIKMTFNTRGLKPYTDEEIKLGLTSGQSLIPTNMSGESVVNAGDLFIHELQDGKRNLRAVLNRDVIRDIIQRGTLKIALSSALASHEGNGRIFSERLKNFLHEPNNDKAPIEQLLEQLESAGAKDIKPLQEEEQFDLYLKERVRETLSTFNRDQLKNLIKRSKALSRSGERDSYSVESWLASYERITTQAPKEIAEIQERLLTEENSVEGLGLKSEQAALSKQLAEGDFRSHYQALLKADFTKSIYSKKNTTKWYKAIPYKKLAIFTAKISAVGLLAYQGVSFIDGQFLDHAIALKFHIFQNWINQIMIFGQLGTHPAYVKPLILGTLSMLAIMPMAALFSQMSVFILHNWSVALGKISEGETYRARIAKVLSQNLGNTAQAFKDLDFKQRIVTFATRPYTFLLLPLYVRVCDLLRQPTMLAFKAKVSPFRVIKADSDIGKAIGMSEGDKSFRQGFNNPFLSKEKLSKMRDLQLKAIAESSNEALSARNQAFLLATLVISQERNIDPATLVALMKGDISYDQLTEIYNNEVLKKKWELVANSLYVDLLGLMKNSSVKIDNLDVATLDMYYKKGQSVANLIEANSKIKIAARKLKNTFVLNLTSSGKALAEFSQENYQKLRKNVANKFVGNQTWSEFYQDHVIVSAMTSTIGERANLSNPPEVLAHGEGHFLWTTPSHGTDMFSNTFAHLISAGPKRMLIYQQVRPKAETGYLPLENILIESKIVPEKLHLGVYRWFKEVLNLPKSNLGAIYSKLFVAQMTTFQVGLIMTVAFRHLLGGQPLEQAFIAWLFFLLNAVPVFGWPWEFLGVGNSLEEDRIAERVALLKNAQNNISKALREKDDQKLWRAYNDLSDLYAKTDGELKKEIKRVFSESKKFYEDIPKLESKIKDLIENNPEKRALILGIVVDINEANKTRNQVLIKERVALLERMIHEDMPVSSIEEKLKLHLQENALKLADFSIQNPPMPLKANRAIAEFTTLILGACLTTYLSISLSVDSFNPAKLTGLELLKSAGTYLTFIAVTYSLASTKGYNFFVKPVADKVKGLAEKAIVRPAVAVKGSCKDLMKNFFK